MVTESTQVTEEESGSGAITGTEGGAAGGAAGAGKARLKRKSKRTISDVIVHVYASFNNTLITVTDVKGNTLSWATAGGCGFRGSRKSTPFAGQVAAGKAIQKARELYGVESAEVRIYGPGPGRDASVRAVRDFVSITAIFDVTGIPFNGCRAPKQRRV
ncbi:30S ribosomal protein S11 [Candidatus Berkiella aquae]|uniref:Small ribosomal subunit protein uS11 n=1 Tax=Candidatus Berkiella aquae TaxID=295108 RepID=A0A0Q9YBH9_9GAMM|nr:30S ribosomal protein S11 [Candidatus Berkiella aquae]MCS5710287.1 30S ribosomal protein S11 [Candidatus Berkiella aquae]